MPKSHRNFLESLELGVSVRAYCLREWRKVLLANNLGVGKQPKLHSRYFNIEFRNVKPTSSIKGLQRHSEKLCQAPVERIAALEDAFNNCIESLLKYCSLRQRFLTSFGLGFSGLDLFLVTQGFMDEI